MTLAISVKIYANFQGYNDVVAESMSAPIVGGSAQCAGAIRDAFTVCLMKEMFDIRLMLPFHA